MTNSWGNPVALPNSKRAETLAAWQKAKATLEAAKTEENRLRSALIEMVSDVSDVMATGTENVEMGGGKLKIVRKLNYGFTGNNDAIDAVLDTIEKNTDGGNIIAERIVKWKPELSLTEYKLLSPENKRRIDAILKATPATPAVSFEPTVG